MSIDQRPYSPEPPLQPNRLRGLVDSTPAPLPRLTPQQKFAAELARRYGATTGGSMEPETDTFDRPIVTAQQILTVKEDEGLTIVKSTQAGVGEIKSVLEGQRKGEKPEPVVVFVGFHSDKPKRLKKGGRGKR